LRPADGRPGVRGPSGAPKDKRLFRRLNYSEFARP